jgi:two-component sensor histidine kinase
MIKIKEQLKKNLNKKYLYNIQNMHHLIKSNLLIIGELTLEHMEKIQDIAEFVEIHMD